MDRRNVFRAALAAAAGFVATRGARADEPRAEKVVYHLADADKAAFVLGNLHNHLVGAGGPAHIRLSVVVHGPALKLFHKEASNPLISRDAEARMKDGVVFYACANTLAAQNWTLGDVTPGFVLAEKGGVVRLADLQAQGWIYLRP